jgi:nucleoside permease NupC
MVMSVLTTLLFYWRILPPIVRGFSWALEHSVGGAVGFSTAANILLGMVESVMAPKRRADIISLGCKSIVSRMLTTCLLGAIVGVLN